MHKEQSSEAYDEITGRYLTNKPFGTQVRIGYRSCSIDATAKCATGSC